ncbi:MAG TPA: hypothetical protein VMV29_01940 [Ktedonobacterales bacterium]|nr:hypothetical protein [Ktedonobacterales bacterium]
MTRSTAVKRLLLGFAQIVLATATVVVWFEGVQWGVVVALAALTVGALLLSRALWRGA